MSYIITIYYGFFCLLSQIILLKELAVLFAGQEIFFGFSLAGWLLWTGLGNRYFAKFSKSARFRNAAKELLFVNAWAVLGLAAVVALLAIRFSKALLPVGALPGIPQIFTLSVLLLLLPCFVQGFLFNLISTLFFGDSGRKKWVYMPYALETLGAVLAGILHTFYLAGRYDNFEIIIIAVLFLIFTGWIYYRPALKSTGRAPVVFYSIMVIFVAVSIGGREISKQSKEAPWKGYEMVVSKESRYGSLLVMKRGEMYSLVNNGAVVANFPDKQGFESKVHWPMLAHGSARSVLAGGQILNGGLFEIYKYPVEHVKFIEKDEVLVKMVKLMLGERDWNARSEKSLEIVNEDIRRYLKQYEESFDVVLLNLPQPFNLEYNRYYTVEFFREVKKRLNKGGVFSFQLPGRENHLSKNMRKQLRSIIAGLKEVFSSVELIPGDEIIVIASESSKVDADVLIRRYEGFGLENTHLIPKAIRLKLNSATRNAALAELNKTGGIRINSDIDPGTYRYSFRVWLEEFFTPGGFVLIGAVVFIIMSLRGRVKLSHVADMGNSIFWFSMAGTIVEIIIILLFQSLYGSVYQYLGVLFSLFMSGLFAGSLLLSFYAGKPESSLRKLNFTFYSIAFVLLLLAALLLDLVLKFSPVCITSVLFAGMFIDGFLVGGMYSICGFFYKKSDDISENVGRLYSADLLGASAGLLVFSIVLINLVSYRSMLLLGAVFLGAIAFLVMSRLKKN